MRPSLALLEDLVGRFLFYCQPRGKPVPKSSLASCTVRAHLWHQFLVQGLLCHEYIWILPSLVVSEVMTSKLKRGYFGIWSRFWMGQLGAHIHPEGLRWGTFLERLGFTCLSQIQRMDLWLQCCNLLLGTTLICLFLPPKGLKNQSHPIRFQGSTMEDDYEEGESCESDEGEFVDDPPI